MKKGGACINLGNEVDAWSGKTGAHASLLGSVGRAEPRKHHAQLAEGPILCPAAAQPDAGGLKVRTGGVGMGSNPSAAVGSSDSIPAQLQ